jgi:hypothetical protein
MMNKFWDVNLIKSLVKKNELDPTNGDLAHFCHVFGVRYVLFIIFSSCVQTSLSNALFPQYIKNPLNITE